MVSHELKLMRSAISFPIVVLCCLASLVVGVQAADEPRILTPTPSSFETLSRFTELLEALQKTYALPARVNTAAHTTAALRGFVRSIDPEADLLTPEEAAVTNELAYTAAAIGLSFAIRDDFPTVISPRDGSPAENAGLLAGEQIIAVSDVPTPHARRIEVDRLLGGPRDFPVNLRILDPRTGAVRDLHVRRTVPGPAPQAALRYLDKGIAYYRLSQFTQGTVENLRAAMILAKSGGASGIILDLRNNAGGAFEAAQVAASFFLVKATEIGSLEYGSPGLHTTFVSDENLKITAPLVLLVNGGTAAEAEVFAAGLQDNKRARIVGTQSFGRGFLTASTRLSNGSVLVLPTAYYMRPSKQVLQDKGLTPDVIVELPRETERSLARAGFGTFDWKNDRREVLATDLPLAKAMSLLAK
jgi:carboxyl-terminal processing protease